MKIELKEVEIVSRADGEKVAGLLCGCPNCRNEAWYVYMIRGFPHLQCTDCGETFCQGGPTCCKEKDTHK